MKHMSLATPLSMIKTGVKMIDSSDLYLVKRGTFQRSINSTKYVMIIGNF